jgi:DNA-binding CsgD family transcriptional regulator
MTEDMELLSEKLDNIIQLIAVGLVEGKKQREQIRILFLAGLRPSRIAAILGTTPNNVNVALTSLRREGLVPRGQKGK